MHNVLYSILMNQLFVVLKRFPSQANGNKNLLDSSENVDMHAMSKTFNPFVVCIQMSTPSFLNWSSKICCNAMQPSGQVQTLQHYSVACIYKARDFFKKGVRPYQFCCTSLQNAVHFDLVCKYDYEFLLT